MIESDLRLGGGGGQQNSTYYFFLRLESNTLHAYMYSASQPDSRAIHVGTGVLSRLLAAFAIPNCTGLLINIG